MRRPEGEPTESGPRVVRLGEPFQMNPRPVDPKTTKEGYPHFFEEPIVIPELNLSGELYLYADGAIAPSHVTPLGLIEFPAQLDGNAIGFDKSQGPLMLSLILKGNENIKGRKMVVETERGAYTARSQSRESALNMNDPYCRAGAHKWDSSEKYPDFTKIEGRHQKRDVTAYFPHDPARLRQANITIF